MDFRILGPLEVLDEERVLDVGGGKQRAVLALLLLHPNEVVSSDRLVEGLWPVDPPPSAAKIVQAHISRLRKALDGAGEGVLLTRGRGYVLRVAPGELDRDRFEALLEQGRAALAADQAERAERTLRDALALWRGPPLADFAYDSFAQEEIGRLEELQLAAVERRIAADLVLGRLDAVIPELEQLVQRHPLRERLREQLMLALYRAGRQAEALEAYRDARRTLAEELGLEPGPALQQLERAILAHDPALRGPSIPSHRRALRRRAILIAAVVVLAAAAALGTAARQGDDAPRLAALAPDSVGVINPETNRLESQVPVGATPTRIAFGNNGVWVVSRHDKTVTRIDPDTRTVLRTIPVGGPAVDVAVVGTAVWVLVAAESGPAHAVRIDPRLNDIVDTVPLGTAPIAFTSSGGGGSIAAEDDSLWVVTPEPQMTFAKIDATRDAVDRTFTVGQPGNGFDTGTAGGIPGSSGIAIGYGALWAGGNTGVVRVSARSRAISSTIPLGVAIPTAVAVGEGAVWVAARPGFRCCPPEAVGSGTLTRIDPMTNSIEATIPVGGEPSALAVGEGAIWVVDPATRSVVRVDPATNDVVAHVPLRAQPRGIAVGDGVIWVSAS
jgi:YVTN family beta-propeller protein